MTNRENSAPQRVVIVGAGMSGYVVATSLRKLVPDMEITLVGDEPQVPYERPPLSKAVLQDGATPLPQFLGEAEYLARNITLRLGTTVTSIDRAARLVMLHDGTSLPYDRLVLATGARPLRLQMLGGEHIRYLRTFADAEALRARLVPQSTLVCIGAGVIGLEIAAAARALDVEVFVVEATQRLMGRGLPQPEQDYLRQAHEQRGVNFHLGVTVCEVQPPSEDNQTYRVCLSDGTTLHADHVVAGIGIVRNDELAREAGLAVDRGVLVDEVGRSSDPLIFAAGEVAAFRHAHSGKVSRLEAWFHALDHASVVARAIAGEVTPYAPVPRYWSDQYDLSIHVAGLPDGADRVALKGNRTSRKYTAVYLTPDDRIACAVCVNDQRNLRPMLKSIGQQELAPADLLATALPLSGHSSI